MQRKRMRFRYLVLPVTAEWVVMLGMIILRGGGAMAWAGPPALPEKIDFARDIRPILSHHCWSCHGPDEKSREGKLRLDLRESAVAELRKGRRAIVPGKPEISLLIARIEEKKETKRMPPPESQKPLNDQQKLLFRRWVEQGAEYTGHWAFTPPRRVNPPVLRDSSWVRNPIDAFVRDRLEKESMAPSPEADRGTLLRRVSLDLTGLPPTLQELDAFLSDRSPSAYEKVVDRLLASPKYAERMAVAWLDAARYADTNGYNNDEDRTQWPWRDWVIEAFDRNLPFDQFITEQLAGDLLPQATRSQIIATAFNRNHGITTEGGIFPEEYRVEYVADRVHTTSTVLLGLTMQCARCHDHKFDPISQRDYYRFFGFFNNVNEPTPNYANFQAAEPFVRVPTAEQQQKLGEGEKRRREIEYLLGKREPVAGEILRRKLEGFFPHEVILLWEGRALSRAAVLGAIRTLKQKAAGKGELHRYYLALIDPEYRRLRAELVELAHLRETLEKAAPPVMIMKDMPTARDTFLLKRGQYDQHGEKLEPDVPAALSSRTTERNRNRLSLARWLVDPSNPLTARVAVNRWWQMVFGVGLVKTVEDFGTQGELPSHPELLDWLAVELVRSSWNVKAMQKLMVMSATYRQSSRVTPESLERDPDNRLLARGSRFRLSAETIRDNALAISGLLKEHVGGPSVKPYQPAGLWEEVSVEHRATYVPDKGEALYRRSMYTFWKRTVPPPTLMSFDAPTRETCTARRARTNTPLQALILLNDPTYVEAARKLAERMMVEGGKAPEDCLTLAFRLTLSRPPAEGEQRILLSLHQEALARFRNHEAAARELLGVGSSDRNLKLNQAELGAWTTVASILLNLDETISKR